MSPADPAGLAGAVFDHVGLSVADLDAQCRFYGEALGLAVEWRSGAPGAPVRIALLRTPGGLRLELVERRGSTPQSFTDPLDGAGTRGYFHWALTVTDLDAAYASALAAGATPVSTPADAARTGVRFAYVKDPEENLLELVSPAPGGESSGGR
jgi:catechol 2,3-dioxygenase-like lactoylglutathione lyase family enzyme